MLDIFSEDRFKKICYLARTNINKYFKKDLSTYDVKAEYVVVWYGRIYIVRGRRLIKVTFLNLDTGEQSKVGVPIEIILKLPIGSIWKEGKCDQKFDFESAFISIDANNEEVGGRPNLAYTNHFAVSKGDGEYLIDPKLYKVRDIEKDGNTNLVIRKGTQNIIIPSILFFVAHYGVSKDINKILISFHMPEVEDKLNLNDGNGDLITIPDNCVIGDATFLYHLKTDSFTKHIVSKLNRRMLDINKNYYPLKTEPYHQQEIQLEIKGLEIDESTILCTEIVGISTPKGDPIQYRIDKKDSNTYANWGEPEISQFTPIYNAIESEEVILEAERDANNITTAIVRHRIEPIGEIRELIRQQIATLEEAVSYCNSTVIPLIQEEPDGYAVGEYGNANGDIGRLQVLAGMDNNRPNEHNFERLLRYAQSLKISSDYAPVAIDCINLNNNNIFIGEKVFKMVAVDFNHRKINTKVNSIFVMRLITKIGVFYLFDCEKWTKQTQGIVFKVSNENIFLKQSLERILSRLIYDDGRLTDLSGISGFVSIENFKHTNRDSSNWVKTALNKYLDKE